MLDTVEIERAALTPIQHKIAHRIPVTIMLLVLSVTGPLARTRPREEIVVRGVNACILEVTLLAPEAGDRLAGILQGEDGGRVYAQMGHRTLLGMDV